MSILLEELQRQIDQLEQRLVDLETMEWPIIVARASTDAGQSIAHNTVTIVNFEDITFDPGSRITTGANWKFTALVAGYYAVASMCMLDDATASWGLNEAAEISIYKNGGSFSVLDRRPAFASMNYMSLTGSDVVYLAATDYIDLRIAQTSGVSIGLRTNGSQNHIAIWKV